MPCLFSAMFQGEMNMHKLEQEEALLELNYQERLTILQRNIVRCIDCKENPVANGIIILPCKHNYYCDTCAKKRTDEQKPCLLCRGEIKQVKSIFGYKEKCQICNEQQADSVLTCLHCLCSTCYASVEESASKHCPFCRGALTQEKELCRF